MKNKLFLSMVVVSTLLLVPAIGSSSDDKDDVRTLTGCLTKAEGAHEYKLTTENGATWELHSKTVRLSPHRGHTVTVTGKVRHADMHEAKEKAKDEMKEHGMDKDATEHGHLKVTNISMVSDSCKR
jgi:TATA-box binding protein (TBP) (component of TFIID and TFIIIB)